MKYNKTITSMAFILLGLGGLQAQESPTATGGEATGTGGTVSYSVGQVVYTTNTGTNGSVAQGIQQAFEISTVIGINEVSIDLKLLVYPNPTTNYLTLNVEDNTDLNYQLSDIRGKIIESEKVSSNSTSINVVSLPTATYLLKVTKNKQVIKIFKIIKN